MYLPLPEIFISSYNFKLHLVSCSLKNSLYHFFQGRSRGNKFSHLLLTWECFNFPLIFFFFFKDIFFCKFIYLFIFGCVGSSFLCKGFLQLRRAGATLHRGARASHRRSLSRCGAQVPDAQAQ